MSVRRFVYMPFSEFPITYLVSVGSGKLANFQREAIERKSRLEKIQTFIFEPYSQAYVLLLDMEPRLRSYKRYTTLEKLYNSIFKTPYCLYKDYLFLNSTV